MESKFIHYLDETLESFLLRLSQYQGYERFVHFAEDIWRETLEQHEAMAGAFPFELSRVNLYHAQTTSQMRVRVLMHLAKQLDLPNFSVLKTALTHSKAIFSPDYKAVYRNNIDYPFSSLRKDFTPICPECLAEASYIRQHWQFLPYQACHVHYCKLLHQCPECKRSIGYQNSEIIDHCECGYGFIGAKTEPASVAQLTVAQWVMGESSNSNCAEPQGLFSYSCSISERYGILLWYVNRYSDHDDMNMDSFIEYAQQWPQGLISDLYNQVEKADLLRVKPWNQTFFNEAFGLLLKDCRRLPNRQLAHNKVLSVVLGYLTDLVTRNPKTKKPNIGDVLLSSLEASTLLSCTVEEIYRLYEFGEIKAGLRLKMSSKLASQQSVFTLRSVIELKLARMSSSADGLTMYLPEW